MKLLIISAVVLIGLGGIYLFTSSNNSTDAVMKDTSGLSIQTIKNDMASGGQLIDVRTSEEYASGHIDGATNVSLQDIQSGVLPITSKEKPVYVYCRSGNRSSQAVGVLKAAGFQNVIDLGGMTQVQSLGGVIKS